MRPLIASVVACVACAPVALAVDTVEATRVGYGLTQNITVSGAQIGGTFTFPIGQFVYNFRNGVGEGAILSGDTITFCADLAQDILPGYSLYEVEPLSAAPHPGTAMGPAKAQAIADVWAAAAGQQFVSTSHAAAMQMMIWEIVYDFDGSESSIDAGEGSVQYHITQTSQAYFNDTLAIFNSFKTAVGSGEGNVSTFRAVTNGDNQDQMVFIPAPGALAFLGAVAVVVGRRRR